MPKTIPVPALTKVKIKECAALNPEASKRWIAKQFGLHHTTIVKILAEVSALKTYGDAVSKPEIASKPELTEVSEVAGDNWTISLPKTRIHTLEELLEFCKVDLSI